MYPHKNPDTASHRAGALPMLNSRLFTVLLLTEEPLLVHQADLTAQTHLMERDQLLSVQYPHVSWS